MTNSIYSRIGLAILVIVVVGSVGAQRGRAARRELVREITPEVKAALANLKLGDGPRPPGGYLYPDRVGGYQWQRSRERYYRMGVPIDKFRKWSWYVTEAPGTLAKVIARLRDEDPAQPGFQTTVEGKRYTLDARLLGIGAVSVRDMGAVGDGRHDDTDAIQLAIDFARDNSLVCWFPAGDYVVSRTLLGVQLPEIWGNGSLHNGHGRYMFMKHICLVGPSHGQRARLVLKAGTFPERLADRRRFVIWAQYILGTRGILDSPVTVGPGKKSSDHEGGPLSDNDSANLFCNAIRHLDIVVRPNNRGASGVYFASAEEATMRDVRVIFEPNPDGTPNGEAGFSGLPGSGGSVHNLFVQGGKLAIVLTGEKVHPLGFPLGSFATKRAASPAPTVSNSEFVGQTEGIVRGTVGGTLTMVGCRFAMATGEPAIGMHGHSPESTPAVIDCVIEYPDNAPAATVVQGGRAGNLPGFYFENCYVKNAAALEPAGAGPLRKAGWYHVRRAARTRRDRKLTEPLRVPDKAKAKWVAWNRKDPRCTLKNGRPWFEGRPVPLPEKATWKRDGDGIAVTFLLGEPVVREGNVSFAPLLEGQPVGPGPYWQTMRRTHLYRRKLGFDTPGLVNVKDFGATGDGKTDDTRALRKAVATGKDLLLPRGSYRVTDTIELRPGQALVGVDKSWSEIRGMVAAGTVFGGAAQGSPAGQAALKNGVPLLATARGDRAANTICDLGLKLTLKRGTEALQAKDNAAYLLLVQGAGCDVIDLSVPGRNRAAGPPGKHPVLQVTSGGGVRLYNGLFEGGGRSPSGAGAYLLLRNARHPVRFYHLSLQSPLGFGVRMAGSTGGMRIYGVKTEGGMHCLLMAENSRNFGWYGWGAGGNPHPEWRLREGLPPALYRMENCEDFLVAAFSQRMGKALNQLTYQGIREVRAGRVVPLDRSFRPILYQRGMPPFAARR